MANPQPSVVFPILGLVVGVGLAWLLTRDNAFAVLFLVGGLVVILGQRFIQSRRR